MNWMALQLRLSQKFSEPASQPRFNPRPPGFIRPGSATHRVLLVLRENPGIRFSRYQLISLTGQSQKAIDHGLLYLRAQKLIETCPDHRNSRFLRYCIAPGKE
jgi:hypothetical protein